jgi:hypothetical protein
LAAAGSGIIQIFENCFRNEKLKIISDLDILYLGSMTTASKGVEGFIVVETNYRVYVYTGNS